MRVGVFGGVYNPPHLGHLILAQEAHDQLGLDHVLLVPLGEPAHREIEQDPGPGVRYEMCELVARADERLVLSRIELDRSGPSFTVDTLAELRQHAPDDELFLLIGGDQAASLRTWHRPEELMSLARIAVAERDNWRREEILERLSGLPGCEQIVFFDMPRVEVSSTLVRRRVAERRSIRYLVPDAVATLIDDRNLYRMPIGAPTR